MTGLWPLTVMTILALLAVPIFGGLIYAIARTLRFSALATCLSVGLAMFASGPSILIRCSNAIWPGDGLLPGIDDSYFDLFPATAFLTAPYQTASLALTAVALLSTIWAFGAEDARTQTRRIVVASLTITVLILVRPYQAGVLAILLPLTMLFKWRVLGLSRQRVTANFSIIAATVVPAVLYVAWVSRQAVWHTIGQGYLLLHVPRLQICIGFSLLWCLAALGIARAVRERRSDLAALAIWTVATFGAALLLGNAMLKFADGAVIAYSLLGAYGVEPWLNGWHAPARLGARIVRTGVASAVLLVLATTTFADYRRVLGKGMLVLDSELLASASLLQHASTQHAGFGPVLVLANCTVGNLLPGLVGVRSFAGHFALTPDYLSKCAALERAGFGKALLGDLPVLPSRDAYNALVKKMRPDFILASSTEPAADWSEHMSVSDIQAVPIWHGRRWTLFRLTQ